MRQSGSHAALSPGTSANGVRVALRLSLREAAETAATCSGDTHPAADVCDVLIAQACGIADAAWLLSDGIVAEAEPLADYAAALAGAGVLAHAAKAATGGAI